MVGIDIGTDFIRVGFFHNGSVESVTDSLGNLNIPNVISFSNESILTGQEASDCLTIDPRNTVHGMRITLF